MLKIIKNKLNDIYNDNTISCANVGKRIIYLFKQRITKEDIFSVWKLRKIKNSKRDKNEKIRVVFLLQMPEIWSKQDLVYYQMKKHKNIHCVVLAIPEYNIQTREHDMSYNLAYEYACKEKLSEIVKADINGEWMNLQEINPDYVFYQRPYEEYLPEQYRCERVINYAKTCYIPYAFFSSLSAELIMEYNRSFARNIYMNFVGNKELENIVRKKFFWTSKLGLRKIVYLGTPILENIFKALNSSSNQSVWGNWGATSDMLKVLWTPRWTTDEKLGGSHFFNYKDEILKMAEKRKDIFIAFRPHPLAFANYVKKHLMTETEVSQLKKTYADIDNMVIDNRKNYIDTFEEADVLITDISSMLVEFFLTGKPIIFCGTNIKMDSLHNEIISTLYQANNWKDIQVIIDSLARGEDVLQERREEVIKNRFDDIEKTSERIVSAIIDDYND